MKHFSCDVCGKNLGNTSRSRYVVRIEVYPAHAESTLSDDDLDADHLDVMNDLLNDLDEEELVNPTSPNAEMRYDLCPACQARFLRNPLNQDRLMKFDFSKN